MQLCSCAARTTLSTTVQWGSAFSHLLAHGPIIAPLPHAHCWNAARALAAGVPSQGGLGLPDAFTSVQSLHVIIVSQGIPVAVEPPVPADVGLTVPVVVALPVPAAVVPEPVALVPVEVAPPCPAPALFPQANSVSATGPIIRYMRRFIVVSQEQCPVQLAVRTTSSVPEARVGGRRVARRF